MAAEVAPDPVRVDAYLAGPADPDTEEFVESEEVRLSLARASARVSALIDIENRNRKSNSQDHARTDDAR